MESMRESSCGGRVPGGGEIAAPCGGSVGCGCDGVSATTGVEGEPGTAFSF